MTMLPGGWLTARVGDLIDGIEAGKNFRCIERPPEPNERGVVKVSAVSWGRFREEESKTVPNGVELDERARIAEGDLLISRANTIELVGACVRVGEFSRTLYLSDKILRLRAEPELRPWLHRCLSSPEGRRKLAAASSGNQLSMRNISQSAIADLPIPLAPLDEQKRIADKLDAVLSRVDACRERLDRIPAILKRFRQSVLAAATSGKLTEDWRAEQAARAQPQAESANTVRDSAQLTYVIRDCNWRAVTVNDVAVSIFDGPFGSHLKSDDYSASGVRVVRLENIGWLRFASDKETFIPETKYESLIKHTLKTNDVLLSSFIAEEVRVCLLPPEISGRAINKADCFCIRVDQTECIPSFLTLRLACKSTYTTLSRSIHGATRPRINLGQLRSFEFLLPPLKEQTEIVRRVDALFAYADRLEARYAAARAGVEKLTPATLAKAFRGELVPQDPNDEPAADLLARLRSKPQAAPKQGQDRPRQKQRKRETA